MFIFTTAGALFKEKLSILIPKLDIVKESCIIFGLAASTLNVTDVSAETLSNLSVAFAKTEFWPLLKVFGSMLMLDLMLQLLVVGLISCWSAESLV